VNSLAPDLANTLGGIFALREDAFTGALALPYVGYLAVAIGLLAGLSEALAQSVVLFANRVQPLRFIFCLVVNGALFALGYAFLLGTTWAIMELPGQRHVALDLLATVFALSYAPSVLSFLGALPYVGIPLLWLLRIWHLLAVVVGVAAVANVEPFTALTDTVLGWIVLAIAQQTFGRPVARLGAALLDAVAGVTLTDEQLAVQRMRPQTSPGGQLGGAAPPTSAEPLVIPARPHSAVWTVWLGAGAILLFGYVLALTLQPVRDALFGWERLLPGAVRWPLDLVWIGTVGVIVAGFMAPLETLGWWAGWYGGALSTHDAPPGDAAEAGASSAARFVVYLDGISQSSSKYTPDIETFLDALGPRLPSDTRLVRGLMVYSVLNRPLDDDPLLSSFWKFVDALRLKNPSSLAGMLINFRNVLIVGVSADQRYGPLYNFGIAQLVYDGLVGAGYRTGSGTPVTLLGYSGGGQMAAASVGILRRALDAPVEIVSLGGVISGACPLLEPEHTYHFVGTKDDVQRIGPIMFPSRWKIAALSNWNRAVRLGRLTQVSLGPVAHQVPGGMLDPDQRLPDGRTFLEQTLQDIDHVLSGRVQTTALPPPVVESEYDRLAGPRSNALAGASPGSARYAPAGAWAGRLILPGADERRSVAGVWFEVAHAPAPYEALAGRRVLLRWNDEPDTREFVRAVVCDVRFSARAQHSSRFEGLVLPQRVDGWKLVDPLESLAGAHPIDDVFVTLRGPVTVEDATPPLVRIGCEPVQVAAPQYGLVRFVAAADGDRYDALHFDRARGTFAGPLERFRLPPGAAALERDPFNEAGWYAYGTRDAAGNFVVRSLVPRALLTPPAERPPGDNSLFVHVRGTTAREARFAFGFARTVRDELSGEARFALEYVHVGAHDGFGTISGTLDWSQFVGQRPLGFGSRLPVRDVVLPGALDAATLANVRRQLEAMAVRYRNGDGSGASYDGRTNVPGRDAVRAVLAGLDGRPQADGLRARLQSTFQALGRSRVERSSNRYDIGNAWTDPSLDGARLTLGGWRAWNAARAGRALVGALDASAASDASGGAPWPLETVPGRQ
jgi:hypothetical protein